MSRVFNYLFRNKPINDVQLTKKRSESSMLIKLAVSFSILLHLGAATLVLYALKDSKNQRPPIESVAEKDRFMPPLPSPEDNAQVIEARRDKLEKLRAEKREFLHQLLLDLQSKTRSIPLSEFLIKKYVLERNIQSLESGKDELTDEKTVRDKYSKVLKEAREWSDNHEDIGQKLDALHYFTHFKIFRWYDPASNKFIDVLERGYYNCLSATAFLAALQEDILGSADYGIIILDPPKGRMDSHMLSWFRDKNGNLWQMENTKAALPRRVPFRSGLRTTKEIFISAYLVGNGVKVNQLPHKIAMLYKRGIRHDFGPIIFRPGKIGNDVFPIAGVSHSLPKPPDSKIPNLCFNLKEEECEEAKKLTIRDCTVAELMRGVFEGHDPKREECFVINGFVVWAIK